MDRSLNRANPHALVERASTLGDVTGVIHAAGVSPSQASPATILAVDLYGTALVLEEFGNVGTDHADQSVNRRLASVRFSGQGNSLCCCRRNVAGDESRTFWK